MDIHLTKQRVLRHRSSNVPSGEVSDDGTGGSRWRHVDRGSVLPILRTEEELSLLGERRPLRLERGRAAETDLVCAS